MVDLSSKIERGDKLYYIHEAKNKFWEICNDGKENHVRYGKWNKMTESRVVEGKSVYPDTESALNRALIIIMQKLEKGYVLLKKVKNDKPRVFNRFAQLIYKDNARSDEIELEIN